MEEEKKKIHQRASSSFSRKRRINYLREKTFKLTETTLLTDFFGAFVLETTWTPANWVVSANMMMFVRDDIYFVRGDTEIKKTKRDEISSFEKGRGDLFFVQHQKGIFGDDRRRRTKRKRRHKKKKQKIQNTASSNC